MPLKFNRVYASVAAGFRPPLRDYILITLLLGALAAAFFFPAAVTAVWGVSLLGSLPVASRAGRALGKGKITIDVFNAVALIISFSLGEVRSAAFIALMLAFAHLLEWYTESRTHDAMRAVLALKPDMATRVGASGKEEEVSVEKIREGDTVLLREGGRIPVDGVMTFGTLLVDEALVTGESMPVVKKIGDLLLSGTLATSGVAKLRATHVGEDSTIERMAKLIYEGQKNKSHAERLADRFAAVFLPIILLIGFITYMITRNAAMTAAVFLVACADDMAVAIPLATAAAIGRAARRGVIIKGGEWLESIARIDALVLDKTGTLTYGSFSIRNVAIRGDVEENTFWTLLGGVEKFSEHPIGQALFREARERVSEIPDPDEVRVHKGSGIWARIGGKEIAAGDESIFGDIGLPILEDAASDMRKGRDAFGGTTIAVVIDGAYAGTVSIGDVPRPEAKESIAFLKRIGIRDVFMFTGDNERVAASVATTLGISEFKASMTPDQKLDALGVLSRTRHVAMVGDGVNDAPALARADVGIAMGGGRVAVTAEAADIVILADNLVRIPEMVLLGRKTRSIIRWDIGLWLISNAVGFALVFMGIAGPAFAAAYNFATDFLPLLNSARLYKNGRG